jgi:hypothetical protein
MPLGRPAIFGLSENQANRKRNRGFCLTLTLRRETEDFRCETKRKQRETKRKKKTKQSETAGNKEKNQRNSSKQE